MRRLGLWPVLCCMLLALALPAWAAPQVEMTVQPANEGRVKQGGWMTVVVELVNRGGDITGELVVEPDTEEMPHTQQVVPFTLPGGGRKRIPVSLEASGSFPVVVRLYAGGQLVEKEQLTFTWLPPQAMLVGVLSSDELGIPALSQLQTFGGQSAQVARLDGATFPDRAALLEDFDVLALSRFDTSSLSAEQLRALEVWVGRGGTLVLAGGPEWRRTLAPLPPSLVPLEVTGVREMALDKLGTLADRPLTGTGPVSEARLRGARAQVEAEGVPLVATATVGSGRLIYLAFDPGLNPVVSWSGQTQFFNTLLANSAKIWVGGQREWLLQEALKRIPDWALPGVWTVSLLLGGYLLLVGPANYLLLKRLDKREWGWVSVPGLSILFLGFVYTLGFGRFQPLVSHLITVTELSAGTNSATMTSLVGLYAPTRSSLSVQVEDARLVRPFHQGPWREGTASARVIAGEKTTIELLSLNNYSMSGFRMEHDIPLQGGLDLVAARVEGGRLTGRLKNRLAQPVSSLWVTAGGFSQPVGRLEPGQTSEPFELTLGNTTVGFDPKMGPGMIIGASNSVTEEPGPDEGRRSNVRQYVLEVMGQKGAGGVLVSGWTEQPLASPRLPELGKSVQGANLVYGLLPLPMGGDSAEIPAGLILGRPADPNQVEWMPHGYLLRPGTHLFTLLLPPLEASQVSQVTLHMPTPLNGVSLRASVKNQQTGEWLPVAEQNLPLPGWRAFVSPVGLIELQIETNQHVDIQPPTVSVKGVAR